MKPLMIVGIDPSTTCAYAVLDLNGNVLKTHSAREFSLSMMLSQVTEFSRPLIVATDKAKVPVFVEDFARKVGTKIVIPMGGVSTQ